MSNSLYTKLIIFALSAVWNPIDSIDSTRQGSMKRLEQRGSTVFCYRVSQRERLLCEDFNTFISMPFLC